MPEFVDWRNAPNPAALVEQAIDALRRGEWIGLPTECGPAAVASARQAVVDRLPQGTTDWSLAPNNLQSWLPALEPTARRLAKRCWPGPATLEVRGFDAGPPTGRLSPQVWSRVFVGGSLSLRIPGHDAILALLEYLGEPMIVVESPGVAGPAWIASLGNALTLVWEGGPPAFDRPPTRVRIEGGAWSIQREGVYTAAELQRLAACVVVFVCTGNTCRSPMAEAICKQLLAERLKCSVGELTARGWWVMSAGVAAEYGEPATPEAQDAVRRLGADLTEHGSRPLSPELIDSADHVVVMTGAHAESLRAMFPALQPRLLSPESDLPDPFRGTPADYAACAATIRSQLQRWLAEGLVP